MNLTQEQLDMAQERVNHANQRLAKRNVYRSPSTEEIALRAHSRRRSGAGSLLAPATTEYTVTAPRAYQAPVAKGWQFMDYIYFAHGSLLVFVLVHAYMHWN